MREFWAMVLVLCVIMGACCLLYIQAERPETREAESIPTTGSTATSATTGTTAPPFGIAAPTTSMTGTTGTTGTTAPPTTGTTAPPVTEPDIPVVLPLAADYAFAYDHATGEIVYTHGDLYAACFPASITKIFTAYVALQILDPDTLVYVGSEIDMIAEYSSVAKLSIGDVLTVEQLVAGMLLPSGNDAAYALAVAAGRALSRSDGLPAQDALDLFMAQVNSYAAQIGLTNTHFVTPDGNDAQDHYSCAYDILTMALLAYENPIIGHYASLESYSFTSPGGKKFSWKNSNLLLRSDSEYYTPEAVGLKTGSTSDAGNCLVSLFEVDGRLICICVLGCDTSQQRYDDTLLLYQHITA